MIVALEMQRRLRNAESGARMMFRQYCFNTRFGFFVPAGAFATLESEMNTYKSKLNEIAEEVISNLPEIEAENVSTLPQQ